MALSKAPVFGGASKSIANQIEEFYNKGSILPSNKFYVGLWGEYVGKAINKMESNAVEDKERNYIESAFNLFVKTHVINNNEIEFFWTISQIKIPTIQTNTTDDFNIDAIKTINYPLVTGHKGIGQITLTVIENRNMMLYQFFNSLMNEFFNAKILKPKSSFQKLGLCIAIINGDQIRSAIRIPEIEGRLRGIEEVQLQVFEFNSVVMKGMSELEFSQELPAKKLAFTVTFDAPNLFQRSFKTVKTFRGIRDNSSDQEFMIDGSFLKKENDTFEYNPAVFEQSINQIKANPKNLSDNPPRVSTVPEEPDLRQSSPSSRFTNEIPPLY